TDDGFIRKAAKISEFHIEEVTANCNKWEKPMIEFELTPKHAGIVIWGDTWSLQAMYELIHKINESSPIIEDKEGFFLGLAQSHVEKVINSRCRYFIDLPPKE